MKSKVMDRPMFKQKEDMDPENVGIMSGFKDMDIDDLFEDEMEEGEDMYDSSAMLERRPDSPEILMNNLRGDMRSVDARREELADLVGYNAAMETPEEVLALLQSSLAGGIGGLPTGPAAQGPAMAPPMPAPMPAPMPQDMGMMPPGMPAEAPPMEAAGMPPLAMAQGGIVQRFRDGTDGPDEDQDGGVSPAGVDAVSYPPEMVSRAQREMIKFIAQAPRKVPSLRTAMQERVPIYQELLGGGGRDAAQAQMLFDISGAFLGFAANRGPQGEALKGSPFARFAGATRALPGQIGARAGELAKQEQAVQLAALQAGEREVESIRAQNAKLIESQRRVYSDIIKKSGGSPFGKGDWEWGVINTPGLIASWAAGLTSPEQDNLVESAIAQLNTPMIETRVDPVTKEPFQVTRRPELPPFLANAIKSRSALGATRPSAPAAQPTTPQAAPQAAPQQAPVDTTGAATVSPVAAAPAAQVTEIGAPLPVSRTLPEQLPPPGQAGAVPQRGGIWGMSGKITGPGASVAGAISGIPGLGAPFPEVTQAQNLAQQEVENLIQAFMKNERAPVTEQERLRRLYDIGPKFFDDPAALRDRLIAIDEEIAKEIDLAARQAYNTELPPDTRAKARTFLSAAEKFRSSLGVPVRVYTEEQAKQLPPGTEYLWQGKIPARRGGGKK